MKEGLPAKADVGSPNIAIVAIRVPGRGDGAGFHYLVPPELSGDVELGSKVRVPFRKSTIDGYVIGFAEQSTVPDPKPILRVVSREVIPRDLIRLSFWLSERYLCSMGEAVGAMLPARVRRKSSTAEGAVQGEGVAAELASTVDGTTGVSSHVPLSDDQSRASRAIRDSIRRGEVATYLLYGVTGSGKTNVYFEGIEEALSTGKDVIVLVPEIALTPQTFGLLRKRFGDIVSIWHSGMNVRERGEQLDRICLGRSRIVVGPRSAIFAPVRSLGLIVVDEEHELTYKQQEVPRYNAKEVAFQRAREHGATVVLSSATPSIESYFASRCGGFRLLRLDRRVAGTSLPRVDVVDMRGDVSFPARNSFSARLAEAIKKTVSSGQQAILFLNRRGFSSFVVCRECGYSLRCPHCDVSLTLHLSDSLMYCHYCGFKLKPPVRCPRCGGTNLRYSGIGTERVERDVKSICPGARVGRMDSDSLRKRGSHELIWRAFVRGDLDILVGTQMVAKGFDVPRVTLVGVVLADTMLNLPDFRSAERTFQLLTQVAGRAGRGELGGEVIVQTYNPEHYGIQAAVSGNFDSFYEVELASRQEVDFPPFVHLALLRILGMNEKDVIESSKRMAELCRELFDSGSIRVLGPAPCPFSRLRGKHRWHVLVKARDLGMMLERLREVQRRFRGGTGIRLSIDVDPVDMM